MKITWMIGGLALVALIGVACSRPKATDVLNFVLPAGHYTLQEAAYGQHPRQRLDIYLPKTRADKPPVVFVYGGAWKGGQKSDFAFVAHALTGLGHPVIIPEYRLYPEVRFPDFIDDVADAIHYVEQHAQTLLGQPLQHFALMGHSAGAHTAALLMTDPDYLKQRKINAKISALIGLSGPYDLPLDDPEVKPIFPDATPQTANPVQQVANGLPPTLLLHGADDKRVLPKHTRRFANALQQAGVPVEMHLYPGVNHTIIIGSLATPLRMLSPSYQDIQTFLEKMPQSSHQKP